MSLVLLYLASMICSFVRMVGSALGLVLVRQKITEFVLFGGNVLRRFRMGNWQFALGWFPLGFGVQPDEDSYLRAGILTKTIPILTGCGLLFAVALLVVGVESATQVFAAAYWQVPLGALSPRGHGAELARQALGFASEHDFVTLIGRAAAVLTAAALLPIPAWGGGDLVLYSLQPLLRLSEGTIGLVRILGVFVGLLMMLSWGVAFAIAMLG